jgi:hypothetical protein
LPPRRTLFVEVAGVTLSLVSFRPESLRGAGDGTRRASGEIDYRLARRHVVAEFKRGRLSRHDVCDAHPELLRAARNVGEATTEPCPICDDGRLVLVSFAFGARLPAHGRCVTTRNELTRLSKRAQELACYVVEVCPDCSWNHLARTFMVGRRNGRTAR